MILLWFNKLVEELSNMYSLDKKKIIVAVPRSHRCTNKT